jgi:LysM repeat protein
MKKVVFVFCSFLWLFAGASVQDSIGVETKDNVNYVRYLVSPGETIYYLSTTHSVSITQLMTDNPGLENGLKVGQIVLLRNYKRILPVQKASVFETKEQTHIVQKGETFYGLSKKYDIPIEQLLKWNGVELKEGQVLQIKTPNVSLPIQDKHVAVVEKPKVQIENKPVVAVKTETSTTEKMEKKPTLMQPETKEATVATVSKESVSKPLDQKPLEKVVTEKLPEPKEEVVATKKEIPVVKTETPANKPVTSTSVSKPVVPKTEELLNENDIYEYNPNKQQVLIIPFDPHLYWSDADDEIMKGSNLKSKLEVRSTIRRRLNALLDPMGYENIQLLGGQFKDTLTDLNKIYTSVSYDYQQVILSEAYKKTLVEQEAANQKKGEIVPQKSVKEKFASIKNKAVEVVAPQPQTTESNQKLDKNADKYFGVLIKDAKFFEYFDRKYSVDYYIFINQFEVITDYEHCLDRSTQNYVRTFVVHFSIFDRTGRQIAGNKYVQNYDSNANNIDKITGDNLQKMADRILMELPLPR